MDEDEEIFIKLVDNQKRLCTASGLSEYEEYNLRRMYRLERCQPFSENVMERKGSIGLSHRKGRLEKINIIPIAR